jgi:hypothetical protein
MKHKDKERMALFKNELVSYKSNNTSQRPVVNGLLNCFFSEIINLIVQHHGDIAVEFDISMQPIINGTIKQHVE